VQIVFVGGRPKEANRQRPPKYPVDKRQPWKPATRPPNRAEKLARFLEYTRGQDEIVRSMMRPDLAMLKAQWGIAA
jgi:hypothetical protein